MSDHDSNVSDITADIVKRANARMRLLQKVTEFSPPTKDLVTVYTMYIRSILEQSCTVGHSRLTVQNSEDLERLQKSALRIILGQNYITYEDGLETLMLSKLSDRREKLCLKFARNCLKNDRFYQNQASYIQNHIRFNPVTT